MTRWVRLCSSLSGVTQNYMVGDFMTNCNFLDLEMYLLNWRPSCVFLLSYYLFCFYAFNHPLLKFVSLLSPWSQNSSSCVCADQNLSFMPQRDLFPTLTKCFCARTSVNTNLQTWDWFVICHQVLQNHKARNLTWKSPFGMLLSLMSQLDRCRWPLDGNVPELDFGTKQVSGGELVGRYVVEEMLTRPRLVP